MRRIKLENLPTENKQTIKQRTDTEFKNWGHSNPLWIVGGAGQFYMHKCKLCYTVYTTYFVHHIGLRLCCIHNFKSYWYITVLYVTSHFCLDIPWYITLLKSKSHFVWCVMVNYSTVQSVVVLYSVPVSLNQLVISVTSSASKSYKILEFPK